MLVPKRVSDFADPGLDPELQRHKWEHHEQIRLERVDVLNAARRAMPPAPAEEATRVPGVAGATILGGATPSASPVTTARRPSTARGVRPKSAAKVLNASVPGVRQSVSAVKEERRRLDAARRPQRADARGDDGVSRGGGASPRRQRGQGGAHEASRGGAREGEGEAG